MCWMRQILITAFLLFCVVEGVYDFVSTVTVLGCTDTNLCIFTRNVTHLYIGLLFCDIYKQYSSAYIPETRCYT